MTSVNDDDEYKEPIWRKPHLKQLQMDRVKEFGLSNALSTEDYVKMWCERNGLRYVPPAPKKKPRRTSR